jgi:pyruvate dehydrogenase E2 component (dihydrolipoamide acetyltransferase)
MGWRRRPPDVRQDTVGAVPDDESAVLPWRVRPPRPTGKSGAAFLSPVVRRLLREHGLEPGAVTGSGEGGRVTRDDVLAVASGETPDAAPTGAPRRARPTGDERVPFSASRRRTAEHMVRSKATSPHITVVVEVDFDAVAEARAGQRRLSYLPFVARAVIDAVASYPHVNASVVDEGLLVRRDVHLGIAVDLDFQGLIVPVVRDAAQKRLRVIAREIGDLAARARERRLSPDEVVGSTFTITNPGPYGTVLSVPVINQPQVAILATDRVVPRPVVIETERGDGITTHPVGRLALTFDHRAFDLAYAAAFLDRVRTILETRDWKIEL